MSTADRLLHDLRALLAEFRSPENGSWLTSACADRLESVLTAHAPPEVGSCANQLAGWLRTQKEEKELARGGKQADSQHLQSAASETEVLSATAPEKEEPRVVVCPSCGDLNELSLFRCGSCEADMQDAKTRYLGSTGHPQRVIVTDTVTGVQLERLVDANEIAAIDKAEWK